jgi:hypothetical protein
MEISMSLMTHVTEALPIAVHSPWEGPLPAIDMPGGRSPRERLMGVLGAVLRIAVLAALVIGIVALKNWLWIASPH